MEEVFYDPSGLLISSFTKYISVIVYFFVSYFNRKGLILEPLTSSGKGIRSRIYVKDIPLVFFFFGQDFTLIRPYISNSTELLWTDLIPW